MMESMQQEKEASEPGTPLKITEDSRKVDSGMDEGSNSSQDLGENSEDEDIVSVKPKKKVHRIFDDESEDSRDVSDATSGQGNSRPTQKELKTAEEVLDEVLNSSSSDESDAEKISLAASLMKKKIRRRKMSEDSSEEDGETLSSVIKNTAKGTMSDIFDAEEDSENEGNTQNSSRQSSQALTGKDSDADGESEGEEDSETKGTNSELSQKEGRKSPLSNKKKRKSVSPKKTTKDSKFGTGGNFKSKEFIEDSSSEDEGGDKKLKNVTELPDNFLEKEEESNHSGSDSDQSSKHNSDGDEGFDESTINPALLKKLKQGAAKKEKSGRQSARSKAQDEKMQIHSESQRMVRESRVSLPYHQPAPRSLNDFLARANKKQQEYKVLKGARDFTKAKLLQDVLQRTKLPAAQALPQDNDSDDDWTPEDDGMKKLKDRLDERLKGKKETDESTTANKSETNSAEKMESSQHEAMNGDSDIDSLPDIDKNDSLKTDDRVIFDQEDGDVLSHSDSVKETEPIEIETNAVDETTSNTEKHVDEVISETDSIKHTDSDEMEIDNDNKVGRSGRTENDVTSVEPDSSKLDKSEGDCEIVSKEKSKQISDVECKDQCAENDENVDPNKLTASNTQNEKSENENETKDLTSILEKKKNRLSALASIDLTNVKPCLSGNSDAFICLEEEEPAPADPGLVKLMDRLCQHSAKREKKHPKDLDISIVQKDKTSIDREELKLNTFTYHTEEEKENPLLKLETPGAKLMALKEQLKAKMKEKREQARQQRQEMYDLDNEEGGFDVEEEEAEMSDRSDTDVEDEDADDEEEDGVEEELEDEADEEDNGEEEERETNPFADDEAAEEDEGDNDISDDDDNDEMNLKLDISDEESESEDQPPTVTSLKKKITPTFSIDESDTADTNVSEQKEEHTANKAFKEPSEKVLEKPFSMFGSKSKESMVIDTQIQSGQRSFSLTFPEESQDLYGNSTLPELGPTQYKQTQESQKLNFYLEDSQSNMLDADGYLRVKSTAKKPAKPVNLDDASESQDQMDDLLNLCSGRFTGISQSKDKASRKSLFDEVKDTQGNMDELMGLCSGVFGDSAQQGTQKKGVKRKMSVEEQDNEDSIEAFSDDERNDEDKEDFINDDLDNDEESDKEGEPADVNSEDEVEDNDDDDGEEKLKAFTGFTVQNKHGKIRQEFVDAEAELSGSEAESDEDLDLAEDDDIMEIEEGDKDAIANNDQLRDEVGRVHLKQLIDEDKRELMRFQEMYLPDGDLHSEGGGRMRRFRWNNNDDTQQDMFDNDSDGEHVEEENDTDFKWRKERFEREQFIQELQEKEQEDSEASQFMKFGKIFLKKQGSLDKTVTADKAKTNPIAPAKESPSSFYKLSKQKRGSFLARSKEALAKIAEMTKPVANPSAGAKSSGKFTFAVISPEKESQQTDTMEKPKRQARTDKSKSKDIAAVKPPAKRQKLDTESSFTQNSVFHHL